MVNLIALHSKFSDRVNFVTVYGLESHPQPGGMMDMNKLIGEDGGLYRAPKTIEERIAVIQEFIAKEKYPIPIVLDTMHNETTLKCFALPERIFILRGREILYKNGKGPPYFLPMEAGQWLERYLDK